MRTFYLDHIKVTRKDKQSHEIVGTWEGYHIHPHHDENGHVLIDFRVIGYDDMARRLDGHEISIISSTKLQPVYDILKITNGANNELGSIDTKKNLYSIKGSGGGHYTSETPLSEIIAHALLSSIHNDIKIYKLDGIKVMNLGGKK
jgi:hypothetical protein